MLMRATRRYWAVAGIGAFLVGLAVLLSRLPPLIGAAGVGTWLLVKQYAFVRALTRTVDDLTIEQTVPRDRVAADTETTGHLRAALSFASPLEIHIEAQPPIAATTATRRDRMLTIEQGTQEATTTIPLRWSVAGSFAFDQPVVEITDTAGLFSERYARGPEPTVIVEAHSPRDVHVGAGGERTMRAYGQRESAQRAAGIDPAELREYQPGDTAQRIDWKATARMNEPFVREYEIETDRVTALFFDHRGTMAQGRPGETKLDYARQVALAFIDDVQAASDPLGYYAVGTDDQTGQREPRAGRYEPIRRRLRDLSPTGPDASTTDGSTRTIEATRHAAAQLEGTSAFDTALAPYFQTPARSTASPTADPLLETVRTHLAELNGPVLTAIFTDDTHKREVQEAVQLARRRQGRVLVFLTPSALFEPEGLTDLEAAYDRYQEFEAFRRRLARLDGVMAYEVGPGDRLDAVLSTGRNRRTGAESHNR
jgi:uncharacterized protein (DUF58 family)